MKYWDTLFFRINKNCFYELVGMVLAQKEEEIINSRQKSLEDNSEEYFENLEKKLTKKFEEIIGSQYAQKIAKKIIDFEKGNTIKI